MGFLRWRPWPVNSGSKHVRLGHRTMCGSPAFCGKIGCAPGATCLSSTLVGCALMSLPNGQHTRGWSEYASLLRVCSKSRVPGCSCVLKLRAGVFLWFHGNCWVSHTTADEESHFAPRNGTMVEAIVCAFTRESNHSRLLGNGFRPSTAKEPRNLF